MIDIDSKKIETIAICCINKIISDKRIKFNSTIFFE